MSAWLHGFSWSAVPGAAAAVAMMFLGWQVKRDSQESRRARLSQEQLHLAGITRQRDAEALQVTASVSAAGTDGKAFAVTVKWPPWYYIGYDFSCCSTRPASPSSAELSTSRTVMRAVGLPQECAMKFLWYPSSQDLAEWWFVRFTDPYGTQRILHGNIIGITGSVKQEGSAPFETACEAAYLARNTSAAGNEAP